jgi:hypothetical protein
VYILTNHETVKNYVKSFNPQNGYMKFTTEKQLAAKVQPQNALKIKAMLDHNKLHATIAPA